MQIKKVIETAKDNGSRLTEIDFKYEKIDGDSVTIDIHMDQEYQEMIGFGGAFTEAAAVTLSKISTDKRQEVLERYFDQEKGIGYSLGRVHIHSCDFSLGNYTYVEENDHELKSFSISRDKTHIIPLIKDAMKQRGDGIKLLASPWSPPAWMKSNHEMNNGGKLLDSYKDIWARYYTKFIKAYEDEGLDVWGITVQNEPAAVQVWDSCIYSAEEERDFIKDHLGPTMYKEGLQDTKILIWDHNRDIMVERAKRILEDDEAAQYVWGTGFHWYVSEEFDNVGKVHQLFPDKHLLFTEGCQEGGVKLGEWYTGERYARNMIGDFNNWCEGYLDWNIVLDETGGPNHVNNLCDAPIIADTQANELHYNSSYYYIGQFSKYVMPGAKRIGSCSQDNKLKVCAFKNPNEDIILILLNESEAALNYCFKVADEQFNAVAAPHSIRTYVVGND
ncbi:glycoside hydrolase family 30 protein [Vallitalea okinawensis]|uniref:glycoside hydrolase family 30 protein n=1 Tax=Vallitalea okinawensis TaxID=2078660 RepID=UPI000CFAA336|nr:glycoside hydrolase family 30 protein [Vallitalea okinawensis]